MVHRVVKLAGLQLEGETWILPHKKEANQGWGRIVRGVEILWLLHHAVALLEVVCLGLVQHPHRLGKVPVAGRIVEVQYTAGVVS